MQTQFSDEGRFQTKNASKYLQQLCKHFAHKIDVQFDENSGKAALPAGPATLTATVDELVVTLNAESPEGLQRVRDVIDSHLERFAFREEFKKMKWTKL
ncbi:DUF2218 domain-containing protein [Falsihalocynthiibacter arcticus]|uniref:2,4-dihydroxyhept-2-ene-1,7-dioic acid aldolase n=1 Tax=Falsihalocynthiibacter arcticus TaxID=1579316 RepID=A0A126V156_9RHOB|nr:DUF2218 domain-containing protein [Falsihalocynthiibacter arcticus]AML51887.1 2,4-dihydroxyhept-2-ene-1,7-dioic acid aldolase [Falsihalocynthiibacter arcticus]